MFIFVFFLITFFHCSKYLLLFNILSKVFQDEKLKEHIVLKQKKLIDGKKTVNYKEKYIYLNNKKISTCQIGFFFCFIKAIEFQYLIGLYRIKQSLPYQGIQEKHQALQASTQEENMKFFLVLLLSIDFLYSFAAVAPTWLLLKKGN